MSQPEYSREFHDTLNESARLLSQNRPGEAVDRLEPLYEQAPENPDVAINLSGAYILQRKWDKAVEMLKSAVETNPENAMLWTNLGAAQLGRLEVAGPKQQERAMEAYWQALRVDPHAPNVHYHLGLIYKERGELTRASAMFQRAVEVNPADRDARYWLKRLTVVGLHEESNDSVVDSQRGSLQDDVDASGDQAMTDADES
ncbi:MAG: tetratricopeptide repeat protein [Caldilineaceae bacterium]|jgi:tetratricopeptide (TPR) repeat protein